MAIDFSQVKTITIPEGEVNKITDSTGNILWKKAPSWHTLWEGNVTASGGYGKEVAKLNALSGTVTLRVTWSCSASGGNDHGMITKYYNNNGTTTTTYQPASPFQFNLNTASDRKYIVGCERFSSENRYGTSSYLAWYHANKTFGLRGDDGTWGTSDVEISMTVTKIEQYY